MSLTFSLDPAVVVGLMQARRSDGLKAGGYALSHPRSLRIHWATPRADLNRRDEHDLSLVRPKRQQFVVDRYDDPKVANVSALLVAGGDAVALKAVSGSPRDPEPGSPSLAESCRTHFDASRFAETRDDWIWLRPRRFSKSFQIHRFQPIRKNVLIYTVISTKLAYRITAQ